MKNLYFALLLILCGGWSASGQKTTIKWIELSGDKIIVHYDLDDSNPNNEYLIQLFASKDNFGTALSKVGGDVGPEIKPGTNKKIEWNIFEEFGSYKGDLAVEIRGRVFIPFVKIQSFVDKKKIKKGKSYDLIWRPGNNNPVHIELYKGSQRMQGELNLPNNGKYTVNFGKGLKNGAHYRVKITDSKKSEDFVYTNEFRVKPKVPLLLKVLPVAGVAAFLTTLKLGDTSEEIPGPPGLPTN
jgi:hypothetical protein